jgi:ferredoxin
VVNFKEVNPSKALLRIEARFPAPGDYRIHVCDQCGLCADNCPEDAIHLKQDAYIVAPDECTGCLICVEVCPHDVMFTQPHLDVPIKCSNCGECARTCPRYAIEWVSDMESEVA